MLRSAASKVMWAGKATVFLVGLAVIVALTVGVVSQASAQNNPNRPAQNQNVFMLGATNTVNAMSSLVGSVADSAVLLVENNGGGPALDLKVAPGQAPMKVNSDGKVANLNADKIDGKDSAEFAAEAEAPGVDSTTFNGVLTLTDSVQNVTSVTVTAPADGFVMVTGSGTFDQQNDNFLDHVQGRRDFLRVFLTRQSGTADFSTLKFFSVPASAPSGPYGAPFSITQVYPVTAGDHTFYLTADKASGSGEINRANITALFIKNGF